VFRPPGRCIFFFFSPGRDVTLHPLGDGRRTCSFPYLEVFLLLFCDFFPPTVFFFFFLVASFLEHCVQYLNTTFLGTALFFLPVVVLAFFFWRGNPPSFAPSFAHFPPPPPAEALSRTSTFEQAATTPRYVCGPLFFASRFFLSGSQSSPFKHVGWCLSPLGPRFCQPSC